jgi:hypothetical protein
MCVVLSKIFVNSLASLAISFICSATYCYLLVKTSGVVFCVIFSFSSSITFLYPLSVCTMIWIYSSVLLSSACAFFGILVKNSFSFFSSLSACCFSSCVFIWNLSMMSCSTSLPSLVNSSFVASTLAYDCTSCVTLTCNL